MKQRILSLLLALALVLSLSACGGKSSPSAGSTGDTGNSSDVDTGNTGEDSALVMSIQNEDHDVPLEEPTPVLDADQVLSKLTFTPQMLYGQYWIVGGESALAKYDADMDYVPLPEGYRTAPDQSCTTIPFRLIVGPKNFAKRLMYDRSHAYLEAHFHDEKGNLVTQDCAYTIDGDTLTLTPVRWEYDRDEKVLRNIEFCDTSWSYQFSWESGRLILRQGDKQVALTTTMNYGGEYVFFYVDHYIDRGSTPLGILNSLNLCYNQEDRSSYIYAELEEDAFCAEAAAKFYADGHCVITAVDQDGQSHTYQAAYLYMNEDGLLLIEEDGTVHAYTERHYEHLFGRIDEFVTVEEAEKVEALPEDTYEALMEKKDDLLTDLANGFSDAGIAVTVNPDTGEMAVDTAVLFGGDSAELSDNGKGLLDRFIQVYASVTSNEKYDGFISQTLVEGHTAPLAGSTYESGLPLSEQRAQVVLDYCLGDEQIGITADQAESLRQSMVAVGCSNIRPVLNPDGSVNLDASRRVCFRFLINLDSAG